MLKQVDFNIGEGSFENGFTASIIVKEEGKRDVKITGKLPPSENIEKVLKNWQENYRLLIDNNSRGITVKPAQITNVSYQDTGNELIQELNTWLKNTPCREWNKLDGELRLRLSQNDEVHVCIETSNNTLRQMPWQLWDLFYFHKNSEFALSPSDHITISNVKHQGNVVRILAILGDSEGINIDKDKKTIEKLPGVEINILKEPKCEELKNTLWKTEYDILFFAGHSSSQENATTGQIAINAEESISIEDLKAALKDAVTRGLKLAIFNSCNGLGLGQQLISFIPFVVVMREAITNLAAQKFLEFFLEKFAEGEKTIFIAVRHARIRLQELEKKEDLKNKLDNNNKNPFKFSSWLPTIFYNPAEEVFTWNYLRHGKKKLSYVNRKIQIFILSVSIITTLANIYLKFKENFQIEDTSRINVHERCQQKYGSGFTADVKKNSVYGWYCYTGNNGIKYYLEIKDFDIACQQQHGYDFVANYKNKFDPYSWYCSKPKRISINIIIEISKKTLSHFAFINHSNTNQTRNKS